MTTTTASDERTRHLTMMKTPADWPAWPALPLERRAAGKPLGDDGILYDFAGTHGVADIASVVFLHNLFFLPEYLRDLIAGPREIYASMEEVYDAGWRVD